MFFLVFLLALVAVSCAGRTASLDGDRLLPLAPEFPSVSHDDETALLNEAELFLTSSPWDRWVDMPEDGWRLAGVSVTTFGGERIGARGYVLFPAPVQISEPVRFIRCGEAVTWRAIDEVASVIAGIHLDVRDSEPSTYGVIPVDIEGDLPSKRDVSLGTGGVDPCR